MNKYDVVHCDLLLKALRSHGVLKKIKAIKFFSIYEETAKLARGGSANDTVDKTQSFSM